MVKLVEDANIPGLGRIVHTECPHNELELESERLSKTLDEIYYKLQRIETDEYFGRGNRETKKERRELERQDHLLHQKRTRVDREKYFCKECSYIDKKLEALQSVGAEILSAAQLATAITKTVSIPEIPFEYDAFRWVFTDLEGKVGPHPHEFDSEVTEIIRQDDKVIIVGKGTYGPVPDKRIYRLTEYEQLLSEKINSLGATGTYVREGILIIPGENPRIYLLRDSLIWKNTDHADQLDLESNVKAEEFLASLPPGDYLPLEREEDLLPVKYEDFGKDARTRWLFGEAAEEYGSLLGQLQRKRIDCSRAYLTQQGVPLGSNEVLPFCFDPFEGFSIDGKENGIKAIREMFLKEPFAPFAYSLYSYDIVNPGFWNCFSPSINSKNTFVRGLIPER